MRICPYGICCPWVRGGWGLDALGKFFRRRRRRRRRPLQNTRLSSNYYTLFRICSLCSLCSLGNYIGNYAWEIMPGRSCLGDLAPVPPTSLPGFFFGDFLLKKLLFCYIYMYIISFRRTPSDGDDGGGGGIIFPDHPSPILHAPRDNISRKGNPSLRYITNKLDIQV